LSGDSFALLGKRKLILDTSNDPFSVQTYAELIVAIQDNFTRTDTAIDKTRHDKIEKKESKFMKL